MTALDKCCWRICCSMCQDVRLVPGCMRVILAVTFPFPVHIIYKVSHLRRWEDTKECSLPPPRTPDQPTRSPCIRGKCFVWMYQWCMLHVNPWSEGCFERPLTHRNTVDVRKNFVSCESYSNNSSVTVKSNTIVMTNSVGTDACFVSCLSFCCVMLLFGVFLKKKHLLKVLLGHVWNVLVIERFVVLTKYFVIHIFISVTLELACWINAIVIETVDSIHIFCRPEVIVVKTTGSIHVVHQNFVRSCNFA